MIRFVDETGSTNADLAAAVRAGEDMREGQWLVARRQTAGRGRQGREWYDGAGNFMGSTLVELRSDDPPPASLSFVAALAVADAANHFLFDFAPFRAYLKWPNDVLLGGGKLAGILLEMVNDRVVIGIGVNLKKAPKALKRRRAEAIGNFNVAPSADDFVAVLAEKLCARLADWRARGLAHTLREFVAASIHEPGSAITVHDTDGSQIEGNFVRLERGDGALLISLADGSQRVIRAGDIL